MNVNQYARRKENILQRMLAALVYVFRQFITPFMTRQLWNQLLFVIYRVMKPFRDEGTQLAREFYDANRAAQLPNADPHDIFTDDFYPVEWLREMLEPSFKNFERTGNVDGAIQDVSNRVVKVVEDGQRRTLIQGVRSDTSQELRGFARFDPRPPTCAFCTMMISRGPVYKEALDAGLDLDNESAAELWEENDQHAMNAMMNRWHPACTCIVIPVYKRANYPSMLQEKEALKIYNRARLSVTDKSFKSILNAMRRDAYITEKNEDEIILASNVA